MAEYLVQDTTMTGIADAVRNVWHSNSQLTPAQIKENIEKFRLGIPISVSADNVKNSHWVRPQGYPNLDTLKSSIPNGSDCVYLTYDLTKTPGYGFISIRCRTSGSSYYVERGHIESSAFVTDESNEIDSLTTFNQLLDDNDGNVQLWRVRGDEITEFGFSGLSGSNLNIGTQPCIECAGKLHHIAYGAKNGCNYTGTVFTSGCTYWTQRCAIGFIGGVITNLSSAFRDCYSLQEIVMDDWDTSDWTVTSLNQMFNACISLQYLDLSSWDTKNWAVTDLANCWNECTSLCFIDFSGWDTSGWNVNSMYNTWATCRSLQILDFTNFDTRNWNVTNIYNMCAACHSLQEIKGLNDLDTSNWHLTTIASSAGYGPFIDCWSLREIDISKWDTSNFAISQAHSWFTNCFSCPTIKCPTDMGDVSTSTNASNPPNYRGLVNFNGYKIYVNHSYSASYMLSRESLISIFTNLPTVSSTKTITIGNQNLAKLTAGEIAIATAKGWTVA